MIAFLGKKNKPTYISVQSQLCEIWSSVIANGNCGLFVCGLVCGMPQTAFLALPSVLMGDLRQLQPPLQLLFTTVLVLKGASVFQVSVSHLDHGVKPAGTLPPSFPHIVPESNIGSRR